MWTNKIHISECDKKKIFLHGVYDFGDEQENNLHYFRWIGDDYIAIPSAIQPALAVLYFFSSTHHCTCNI